MKETILSIIVPVYNVAPYITKCMESIVKQNFDCTVEVLCIDDGSSDDSGKICDIYAAKYSWIYVYHTENRGVAAARNFALDHSSGKYVAWVDSDDYISTNWFHSIKPFIMKEYDLIYYDMYVVFPKKITYKEYNKSTHIINPEKFFYDLMLGNIASHLCSKVFKRSFWSNIRFDTERSYCEDYSVLHRVVINMKKIIYLHRPLYYYYQRGDSIVHEKKYIYKNLLNGISLSRKREKFFLNNNIQAPHLGVIISILMFLWGYNKYYSESNKYEKYYLWYRNILRKNITVLISNPDIPVRKKIQAILVHLNLARFIGRFL